MVQTIRFTKMQGLGNDFVVIDAVTQTVALDTAKVRRLADRHYGVGCDQILLVEPCDVPGFAFRYRIFNADGSEVSQCGNGARCFARFVRDKGLAAGDDIDVLTAAGPMRLSLQSGGDVCVNMGIPVHAPERIPLAMDYESRVYSIMLEDGSVSFGAVSMGNPHAVILVDSIDVAPVQQQGALMESHRIFPERANIGFMQIVNRQEVRLRVFERGAGETLACGSGACAAMVVGRELGLLDERVQVSLPGGRLVIEWSGRGQPVFMTGPAETVFEGQINL
ncbi:MAG: diaminopimelate epimerase [Pseudomonadota bacterium]|jgi:diaminopimelate epimerase